MRTLTVKQSTESSRDGLPGRPGGQATRASSSTGRSGHLSFGGRLFVPAGSDDLTSPEKAD